MTDSRLLAIVAWVQVLFNQVASLGERSKCRVAIESMLSSRLKLSLNGSKTLISRLACAQDVH